MSTGSEPKPTEGLPGEVRTLIDEAERLLKDLTSGEWHINKDGHVASRRPSGATDDVAWASFEEDARFIAAAPRLVRALLDRLARQEPPTTEGDKATRVDDTQYDPPSARPLATAAVNEPKPTTFYGVQVYDQNGTVVTIEHRMLAGRDIGEREEAAIHGAIQQLSGFIGRPPLPADEKLKYALRQIYILARRTTALANANHGRRWDLVISYCEAAGCTSSVLREDDERLKIEEASAPTDDTGLSALHERQALGKTASQ